MMGAISRLVVLCACAYAAGAVDAVESASDADNQKQNKQASEETESNVVQTADHAMPASAVQTAEKNTESQGSAEKTESQTAVDAFKAASKGAADAFHGVMERLEKNAEIAADDPFMKGVATWAKMGNLLQQGMKKAIEDNSTDLLKVPRAMDAVLNPGHPMCKGIPEATNDEWKKPVQSFDGKAFCKFGRVLTVLQDPWEKCFDGDHDGYARQKRTVADIAGASDQERAFCKLNGFCFMKKEKSHQICKSLFPTHTVMTMSQVMQAKQGIFVRVKAGEGIGSALDAVEPFLPKGQNETADQEHKFKLAKATAQASVTFTKTDASKLAEAQCALSSLACDIHYCQEAYCQDEE